MKKIYYIIFIILLNSCTTHLVKDNKIIKYYKHVLTPNNAWYKYKQGYSFYNKVSENFDFEFAVKGCGDVEDTITQVYYKNKKKYEENIPYKSIAYCGELKPDVIKKYDNEGKIIEHISKRYPKTTYSYKKDAKGYVKIENTLSITNNNDLETKSFYNKNKDLIKIVEYENGKQYATYRFNRNKNILIQYDIHGKPTGEKIEID